MCVAHAVWVMIGSVALGAASLATSSVTLVCSLALSVVASCMCCAFVSVSKGVSGIQLTCIATTADPIMILDAIADVAASLRRTRISGEDNPPAYTSFDDVEYHLSGLQFQLPTTDVKITLDYRDPSDNWRDEHYIKVLGLLMSGHWSVDSWLSSALHKSTLQDPDGGSSKRTIYDLEERWGSKLPPRLPETSVVPLKVMEEFLRCEGEREPLMIACVEQQISRLVVSVVEHRGRLFLMKAWMVLMTRHFGWTSVSAVRACMAELENYDPESASCVGLESNDRFDAYLSLVGGVTRLHRLWLHVVREFVLARKKCLGAYATQEWRCGVASHVSAEGRRCVKGNIDLLMDPPPRVWEPLTVDDWALLVGLQRGSSGDCLGLYE